MEGKPVLQKRACRVCGCTDDRACPGGCTWIATDLCSRCTTDTEMTRLFHVGDVLSVTTTKLLSPRGIRGWYDILNFLTQDDLFSHQLNRACQECRPYVLIQHPVLELADTSSVNRGNWRQWLEGECERLGTDKLELTPIPPEGHRRRDPIDEGCEMFASDRVIVVDVGK
jgi:hypothetical protein